MVPNMYNVKFVSGEQLPEGHAWTMGRTGDGRTYLFVDRESVTPSVIEEALAAHARLIKRARRRNAA